MSPSTSVSKSLTLPDDAQGLRLDQALVQHWPHCSRTQIQKALQNQEILLNGEPCLSKYTVKGGEVITGEPMERAPVDWESAVVSKDAPLFEKVFEDEHLIVVHKHAGLVVHPAPGTRHQTLVNYLLHENPSLANLPRAGLIHRLDKDTSGLLVIAKTASIHQALTAQLSRREFKREYLALVQGVPISGGTVDVPIGRDPSHRQRMSIQYEKGREAVTHYRLHTKFRQHALLTVKLETGRTHQIRVHLRHIGFPIFGDPVYGGRLRLPPRPSDALKATLSGFRRQALHASRLGLLHPEAQEWMEWEVALPEDMQRVCDELLTDKQNAPDDYLS